MKHNSKIQPAEDNAVLQPAGELDALGAILLFDRRDQLAELPTDDNVATLKYLASEGMGDDTMRALASDLAHLGGRTRAVSNPALKQNIRRTV